MTMNISFNNPNILKGYLEQALPQLGLENIRQKILIGMEGGLAYLIFSEDRQLGTELRVTSIAQIDAAAKLFDSIKEYVDISANIAGQYGFEVVQASYEPGNERKIMENSQFAYFGAIGMGSYSIANAERFEVFMKMVTEAEQSTLLKEKYEQIINLNNQLKPHR